MVVTVELQPMKSPDWSKSAHGALHVGEESKWEENKIMKTWSDMAGALRIGLDQNINPILGLGAVVRFLLQIFA
jgi:hypothetical protein